MITIKSLATNLVLLGLMSIRGTQAAEPAQAVEPHPEDSGALEHYHHEFYSHSFVDPNYRDGRDAMGSANSSNSKNGHSAASPNIGPTIALGGHRRHQRP